MSEIDIERLKVDKSLWPSHASYYCTEDRIFKNKFAGPCKFCIPRPTRQEWDGEGLPPVGVECEVDDPVLGNWNKCIVKWIGREVVVVDRPEGGELCVLKRAENFRPLKSQQKRQREELAGFISNELGESKYLGLGIADAILSRYNLEPK